jgi:multiple sugar transport system substrate-binding protein
MKRKTAIILALSMVLLTLLSACTSPAVSTAPSTSAAANTATAAAPSDQASQSAQATAAVDKFPVEKGAEVHIATWDSDSKYWDLITAGFNKVYPDIKVVIEINSDFSKILTQVASKVGPDIWQVSESGRAYAKEGLFNALDDYIASSTQINAEMYINDIYKNSIVDGKVMYLPKDYGIQGIFINKKLFDAAGIAIPTEDWTLDQFKELAKKLTKVDASGKPTQWGALLNGNWDIPLDAICEQFGGNLISPDGQTFDGYVNGPKTIEALKWYFSMYSVDKCTPSNEEMNSFTGTDAFAAGKCAMAWQGSWQASTYKESPNVELLALPVPKSATGSRANHITWSALAMYKCTKVPNASWKVLEFFAGEEGSMIDAAYAFPVVKSVAEKAGIAADPVLGVFYKSALNDATPYMQFKNPWWTESGTISQYSYAAFDKLMSDPNADYKVILDDAAQKMTKDWENKKKDLAEQGISLNTTN